ARESTARHEQASDAVGQQLAYGRFSVQPASRRHPQGRREPAGAEAPAGPAQPPRPAEGRAGSESEGDAAAAGRRGAAGEAGREACGRAASTALRLVFPGVDRVAAGQSSIGTRSGSTFQISRMYSRIARSDENLPIRAALTIDMRVQRSRSRHAASTRAWHSS